MRTHYPALWLRFPEVLWALITVYPSSVLEREGLRSFFTEDPWYLCVYAVVGLAIFAAAMVRAKHSDAPQRHRVRAAGVILGATVLALVWPNIWARVLVTVLALGYLLWPALPAARRNARD